MALMGMREVCWGFGGAPLLDDLTFQIEKGERVCLLGRNGVGKSSVLKLFNGEISPDKGEIWRQQGATVAMLEQGVPPGCDGAIFDVVAQGLGEKGKAIVEHARICKIPKDKLTHEMLAQRDKWQRLLDAEDGWSLIRQVENVLSRTGLDPEAKFTALSAGMKRRTLFARALAREPDILLLDEPTNHLDIDTIVWMEDFIQRHVKTLLFVTHDREFLKKIATRIIELDRGHLFSYSCDYQNYVKRKQAALDAEEKQNSVFDKKLSQEETWIRQGIKARRTRNEGRVRALIRMREAFKARRRQTGNVKLQVQEAEKTGKLVIEARNVTYTYEKTPFILDFSTVVMRGDRVGIIGPNGIGKTTLLNLLLKKVAPESGSVRHGTHLQVAYFDQLRAQLDEQKTVQENIAEGNDFIVFNGQKRHVISHLQDFLFSPQRCRTPVYVLSGGEKNRLLLAKLFTKPANVLVLDEPTNDLDAETLELLEELLFNYNGTLLIVSHDRAFLNNVVTSTIAFEGKGHVMTYAGGYDDWLKQRPKTGTGKQPDTKIKKTGKEKNKPQKVRKLGYNETRELEALPARIDELEAEQNTLVGIMSDPCFYKKDKIEILSIKARVNEVENEIETAYLRWEELDRIKNDMKKAL
jgi:ABC transport system ATP-binding/permease protein